MHSKLQYISQGASVPEQLENIKQALDAGCDWIQLRFKNAGNKELLETAGKVKLLCENYGATFIVNDNVEIAKTTHADGVHLGLQDMCPLLARTVLGKDKIIGGTANTLMDVLKRADEKCDYIGLGPFRFTRTKEKLSPVLGIEGYQNIMEELRRKSIGIPVYAIGGIVLEDLEMIMKTGVYGIAVSGIITNDTNKKKLVEQLNSKLYAVA